MNHPRVLVVEYSRTGHTTEVAELVERALDAEIEPLVDRRNRLGLWGYLRSSFEAAFRRPATIAEPACDPGAYDLVVVGTPVWNMAVSSPVRAYLERMRDRLPQVAFFATCGGRGASRAFSQMEEICRKQPLAVLAVREAEIASGTHAAGVERFALRVLAELARRDPRPRIGSHVELRHSA